MRFQPGKSKTVDVAACHVYGHPHWHRFLEAFEWFERLAPTGVLWLVIVGTIIAAAPWVINLLEWRLG